MNGDAPATGTLNFSWDQCGTVGGPTCNVNDINGVSVAFDESPPAPDFEIINTSRAATLISCSPAFNCTASSDPADRSEIEAYVVGDADPVETIDDTVVLSGAGCPEELQVGTQYVITVPSGGLESND
jgi:hypothetical protein